jgi:hypothetical protein
MACDPPSGVWRYNAVPRKARGQQIEIAHQGITVQVNKAAVVAALTRLAANRELYKVRLCEQCRERWRVSERKMDRFCSPECREGWHTKSPDYSERRQEIQRRYRKKLKLKRAAEDAASSLAAIRWKRTYLLCFKLSKSRTVNEVMIAQAPRTSTCSVL